MINQCIYCVITTYRKIRGTLVRFVIKRVMTNIRLSPINTDIYCNKFIDGLRTKESTKDTIKTRTDSQRINSYISLKKNLYIKHNLVSIFIRDKISIIGSHTHYNGHVCTYYTTSSMYHKANLPQYLA